MHENLVQQRGCGFLPVHMGMRSLAAMESFRWSNRNRPEGDFLLHLSTKGGGTFWKDEDGREEAVPEGSAFLVPSPSATSYARIEDQEWEMLWIFFTGSGAKDLAEELIAANGSYVFHGLKNGPSEDAFKRLLRLQYQGEVHPARASGLLCEILHGLSYQQPPALPSEIEAACVYMRDHFHDADMSIDDVAQASGLSRAHFTRIFKKHLKLSPIQWLTELRLKQSVDLICSTPHSIQDIAQSCGFREPAYFNNVFKKQYGYPPGQLKKLGR
ncbi:MAG: helix-turn-helix transcriptional regulator [Planctomycetes bacterium]|nr:helix-turn-helix transcriptional regulator [Planctomycetota bacterium]